MSDENKKKFLHNFAFLSKFKSKKYTSYVIAVILSLIVVVIFLSSCRKQTSKTTNTTISTTEKTVNSEAYSTTIENKLVNVLSFVKGCGTVRAMVVTKSTEIKNIELQTEEKESSGTNTTTKTPIYEKDGSNETPFVTSFTYPQIIGVLIVAEGAGDTNVKLKIVNAIVSVLGIDSSKIEVLEGK